MIIASKEPSTLNVQLRLPENIVRDDLFRNPIDLKISAKGGFLTLIFCHNKRSGRYISCIICFFLCDGYTDLTSSLT